MRLDQYLTEQYPESSRATWQKLIKQGYASVNGVTNTVSKYNVKHDDVIIITDRQVTNFSDHTLPILYEDENVIVIDKPIGVLTHAKGALDDEFTVAEFFKSHTTYHLDTNRAGIIHRLDRATSGVLIGAKNDETAKKLIKQFQDRSVKKTYLALTLSLPKPEMALIDLPIGRNPNKQSTFRVDPNGKAAQTVYETLDTNGSEALVELRPRTGRTHQLRVHMSHIGAPIIGDTVYGKADERLFLHAHQLEITIPGSKRMVFESPAPYAFSERVKQWKV